MRLVRLQGPGIQQPQTLWSMWSGLVTTPSRLIIIKTQNIFKQYTQILWKFGGFPFITLKQGDPKNLHNRELMRDRRKLSKGIIDVERRGIRSRWLIRRSEVCVPCFDRHPRPSYSRETHVRFLEVLDNRISNYSHIRTTDLAERG